MINATRWRDFVRPRAVDNAHGYAVSSVVKARMGVVVHCARGFDGLVQGGSGSTFGKAPPGNLLR